MCIYITNLCIYISILTNYRYEFVSTNIFYCDMVQYTPEDKNKSLIAKKLDPNFGKSDGNNDEESSTNTSISSSNNGKSGNEHKCIKCSKYSDGGDEDLSVP